MGGERNSDRRVTHRTDITGHARTFLPHQQHVIGLEGKVIEPCCGLA